MGFPLETSLSFEKLFSGVAGTNHPDTVHVELRGCVYLADRDQSTG